MERSYAFGDDSKVRKIYVASSWRNQEYPRIVATLRGAGHEVYDFRNPAPDNNGFSWTACDTDWQQWSPRQYMEKLQTAPAEIGYGFDKRALDWCDTLVLVLPCGRSAHLEAGYAAGQGKRTIALLRADKFEPELMYLMISYIVASIPEMLAAVRGESPKRVAAVAMEDDPKPHPAIETQLDRIRAAS
jgi:hypothetical protein